MLCKRRNRWYRKKKVWAGEENRISKTHKCMSHKCMSGGWVWKQLWLKAATQEHGRLWDVRDIHMQGVVDLWDTLWTGTFAWDWKFRCWIDPYHRRSCLYAHIASIPDLPLSLTLDPPRPDFHISLVHIWPCLMCRVEQQGPPGSECPARPYSISGLVHISHPVTTLQITV